MQESPAVHGEHVPPLHTRFVPQEVPSASEVPLSTHCWVPVAHEVVPVWQAFAGVQGRSGVQAPHSPAAVQTAPAPQDVAIGRNAPVSTHTGAPLAHDVLPTWQGNPAGVHAAPSMHALHAPLRHTWPAPQVVAVPLGAFTPVSVQVWVPVAQEVAPTWQGLVGVHTALATHALQTPFKHTWFAPQVVPGGALASVSTQTLCPVAHDVVPRWQAFSAGTQAWSAVHVLHAPAKQTWFVPQVEPFATNAPVSLHTGKPVSQEVVPTWQGAPGSGQGAPTVQALHTPPPHTAFVPQLVPSGMLPVSVQTGAPLAHETAAVWQTLVD